MAATLLVLVGVRGAGKSTAIERLKERSGVVVLVPSTTREPRDGNTNEYDFVSKERWDLEEKAWSINIGEQMYGMRFSEINRIGDKVAVTVFDPGNIEVLKRAIPSIPAEVITVGLDTISDLAGQHARVGSDESRKMGSDSFASQAEIVRSCDIVLQGAQDVVGRALDATIDVIGGRGGLLGGDTIRDLIIAGVLLHDANLSNVSSASYDLRLGDEAWCQGKFVSLDEKNPVLQIPPYSYALVSAKEVARLPRFVSGKFDLKVSLFFRGVVLSNGPQVDPGYRGALFCMLYNGSDTKVGIKRAQHFSTIEFNTTAKVTPGYQGQYQEKRRLHDFISGDIAVSDGGKILERMQADIEKIRSDWTSVRAIWFTCIGIAIAICLGAGNYVLNSAKDVSASAEKVREAMNKLDGDLRSLSDRRKELESSIANLRANEAAAQVSFQKIEDLRSASEKSLRDIDMVATTAEQRSTSARGGAGEMPKKIWIPKRKPNVR